LRELIEESKKIICKLQESEIKDKRLLFQIKECEIYLELIELIEKHGKKENDP